MQCELKLLEAPILNENLIFVFHFILERNVKFNSNIPSDNVNIKKFPVTSKYCLKLVSKLSHSIVGGTYTHHES